MEKNVVILIVVLIFLSFIFLYWKLTSKYGENKDSKIWKHWPTRLWYWQAAVFYSLGLTFVTVYLLRWLNVLPS